MSKTESFSQLSELGFATARDLEVIKSNNSVRKKNHLAESTIKGGEINPNSDYDYLLKMPLSSLTHEKIDELTTDASKAESNLKDLQSIEPEELWMSDLDKLAPHF